MKPQLLEKRVVYEGRKVSLELHRVRTEAGREVQWEVCRHPGAVVILPIAADGTILLISNRRYPVGQTLIELPAGTLEAGEDPAACAARELEEETGHRAGRIAPIGVFYTSPGLLDERMHAFAASDLTPTASALEEDEQIDVLPTPWPRVLEMIREGRLSDAKSIAAILMYDRFHRSADNHRPPAASSGERRGAPPATD